MSHAARFGTWVLGLWLVACTVLAGRHVAQVAHARDLRGVVVHAPGLTGHHDGKTGSDVHGQRDADADHGECVLADGALPSTCAALAADSLAAAVPPAVATVAFPDTSTLRARVLLRDAPKTSPPVA